MTSINRRNGVCWVACVVALSLAAVTQGCGDDDGDVMGNDGGPSGTDAGGGRDAGTTPGVDAGTMPRVDAGFVSMDGGPGGADAGVVGVDAGPPEVDAGPPCPALEARTPMTLTGEITSSVRLTCANLYTLSGLVFVRAPAVVTIDPGVVIRGGDLSALIVTRGASIDAQGTAAQPIVMTSGKAVGARAKGDWGGLVLLGDAPINLRASGGGPTDPPVDGHIEGIVSTDSRGNYGGTNVAGSCGTVRYVRIEFAGYAIAPDNELNGLTLGGCGSATRVEYVQVHRGSDDGIELFGGSANLSHVVLTSNADDSLDWDQGWSGKAQFLAIQQNPMEADSGFEADNNRNNHVLEPVSNPEIWNATLIGTNDPAGTQRGMVLRVGTAGRMHNFVVMGFPNTSIDVRDASTVANATAGRLDLTHSLFFQIGASGTTYFKAESGSSDNDTGFDESAFFMDGSRGNRFGSDPMIANAFDTSAPGFAPAAGSPAATGAGTPPSGGFFDTSATYVGAVAPGSSGASDWTQGWTSYPAN